IVRVQRRQGRARVIGLVRPLLHAVDLDLGVDGRAEDAVRVFDEIGDLLRGVDGLREVSIVRAYADPERAPLRGGGTGRQARCDVRRLRGDRGALLGALRLAPARIVTGGASEESQGNENRTEPRLQPSHRERARRRRAEGIWISIMRGRPSDVRAAFVRDYSEPRAPAAVTWFHRRRASAATAGSDESSTSRILGARVCGVNGFWMNAITESTTP